MNIPLQREKTATRVKGGIEVDVLMLYYDPRTSDSKGFKKRLISMRNRD